MLGRLPRRVLTRWFARRPDRAGVKQLLRLQDSLYYFTLGVIKITEGHTHPRHRVTDAPAFFLSQVRPGDRVLDVGSAFGHNAVVMAERAAAVVGIEIRPDAVARARAERSRPNVEYRVGTLDDLAPDDQFDVALLGNVLEHIADRAAFLAQVRAHARRIVVRVPAIDRDWMIPYRQELGMRWKLHLDHEIEYTVETLSAELGAAGFRVTTCFSKFGAIHAAGDRDG
jgi:SAM-dependent methyltransferase